MNFERMNQERKNKDSLANANEINCYRVVSYYYYYYGWESNDPGPNKIIPRLLLLLF